MNKGAPRFPVEFPVTLALGDSVESPMVIGQSRNLSCSGVLIELKDEVPLHPGTELTMILHLGEDQEGCSGSNVRIKARMIWQNRRNCGFAITGMAETAQGVYEHVLEGFEMLGRMSAVL